ncbi:MAG: hypothetical protein AAF543_22260 [Pseudomonadota bacterium]
MTAPAATSKRKRSLASALVLTTAAVVGAGLVQAEVVDTKGQGPSEAGVSIHDEPVQLECWQNGRRIIQEDDLGGLAVKAVTQKGAVAFKQADREGPDTFLLPFEGSLCLVAPEN